MFKGARFDKNVALPNLVATVMAITVVHFAYENCLVNNGHDSGHLIEHAFRKQHVPRGKGDTRVIILRIGIPVNK